MVADYWIRASLAVQPSNYLPRRDDQCCCDRVSQDKPVHFVFEGGHLLCNFGATAVSGVVIVFEVLR